jgi:biotin carboxyl carrier protein
MVKFIIVAWQICNRGEFMDTKNLSQFIAWSKTTDLQEITYKTPGSALEIKTAAAEPTASDFSCKLSPVTSHAVGIYHAGKKGKEVILKENCEVKKGQFLGVIEMNKTEKELTAPCDCVIKIIPAKDGAAVEYGQPLFFVEPK